MSIKINFFMTNRYEELFCKSGVRRNYFQKLGSSKICIEQLACKSVPRGF